jgi:hypothetical protein
MNAISFLVGLREGGRGKMGRGFSVGLGVGALLIAFTVAPAMAGQTLFPDSAFSKKSFPDSAFSKKNFPDSAFDKKKKFPDSAFGKKKKFPDSAFDKKKRFPDSAFDRN